MKIKLRSGERSRVSKMEVFVGGGWFLVRETCKTFKDIGKYYLVKHNITCINSQWCLQVRRQTLKCHRDCIGVMGLWVTLIPFSLFYTSQI